MKTGLINFLLNDPNETEGIGFMDIFFDYLGFFGGLEIFDDSEDEYGEMFFSHEGAQYKNLMIIQSPSTLENIPDGLLGDLSGTFIHEMGFSNHARKCA